MNPPEIITQDSFLIEETASFLSAPEKRVLDFYDNATERDWEEWRWQLGNRITDKNTLGSIISLTDDEQRAIEAVGERLSMAITPYFASLIDPNDPACPIRRQCVPVSDELFVADDEFPDPCAEDSFSPVQGVVHRYPDRVLFLTANMCAMYCRYCTRSRMIGDGKCIVHPSQYNACFEYIREHKEIRDVLISGGDPLLLSDAVLLRILTALKSIDHVEFVRIGTRVPVTLPQRITDGLLRLFKEFSPLWMSIHVTHPNELTPRVQDALNRLADAGIPLGSQTVLLKGINDSPRVMKKLMHRLLMARVRPYYIYQCDPIIGTKHFRTPISTGIRIIETLRGHTSGYAVPTFVVDAPGGGGKVPIAPQNIVSFSDGKYIIKNYAGGHYTYYDP